MRKLILSLLFLVFTSGLLTAQQFDLVIEGGRLMDPETRLDAVRNLGIRDGKIAQISEGTLPGKRVIQAHGLIVAPGFIDVHQHAQELASQRVKAFDGVTTALEMEIGAADVAQFLKEKEGRSLIHYGTTASYLSARSLAFGTPLPAGAILPKSGPATDERATPEPIAQMQKRLD
jgi:N-acyl-D-glutamate deacylase